MCLVTKRDLEKTQSKIDVPDRVTKPNRAEAMWAPHGGAEASGGLQ
jgi:hypothetical protein